MNQTSILYVALSKSLCKRFLNFYAPDPDVERLKKLQNLPNTHLENNAYKTHCTIVLATGCTYHDLLARAIAS
jgi:hypothetical protein